MCRQKRAIYLVAWFARQVSRPIEQNTHEFNSLPVRPIGRVEHCGLMRNAQDRMHTPQLAQGIANICFTLWIQGRGRLIQYQQTGTVNQGTCNHDPLPLATGQFTPSFTHKAVLCISHPSLRLRFFILFSRRSSAESSTTRSTPSGRLSASGLSASTTTSSTRCPRFANPPASVRVRRVAPPADGP